MALMFPWATKEYLLWNMTIGQIVMYHNKAMDIKNGVTQSKLMDKSAGDLRKMRDQLIADAEESDKQAEMQRKYGKIEG